jgi:predicted 3-demethylubiquinone-9 3-methyltransferase (glyoxalase superfamily)
VLTVDFELDGQPFTAINGGPEFTFSEAVSFLVLCADQEEIDYYWDKLSEGGEEGVCGWLKDRFGLSWQVVPEGWDAFFKDPDPRKANAAMTAVFGMKKIDAAAVQAAVDQV